MRLKGWWAYHDNCLSSRCAPSAQLSYPVPNSLPPPVSARSWLTTRRGGRDVFSFCGHPFVLDAAAKAIVLQHDAQREQSEQAGMALFASLLGMGAGGMASRYFVLPVRREHLVEDALTGAWVAREESSGRCNSCGGNRERRAS